MARKNDKNTQAQAQAKALSLDTLKDMYPAQYKAWATLVTDETALLAIMTTEHEKHIAQADKAQAQRMLNKAQAELTAAQCDGSICRITYHDNHKTQAGITADYVVINWVLATGNAKADKRLASLLFGFGFTHQTEKSTTQGKVKDFPKECYYTSDRKTFDKLYAPVLKAVCTELGVGIMTK